MACVAFTGVDTRIMLNSQDSTLKVSALERKLNIFVLWVVGIDILMCAVAAWLSAFLSLNGTQEFYETLLMP